MKYESIKKEVVQELTRSTRYSNEVAAITRIHGGSTDVDRVIQSPQSGNAGFGGCPTPQRSLQERRAAKTHFDVPAHQHDCDGDPLIG